MFISFLKYHVSEYLPLQYCCTPYISLFDCIFVTFLTSVKHLTFLKLRLYLSSNFLKWISFFFLVCHSIVLSRQCSFLFVSSIFIVKVYHFLNGYFSSTVNVFKGCFLIYDNFRIYMFGVSIWRPCFLHPYAKHILIFRQWSEPK